MLFPASEYDVRFSEDLDALENDFEGQTKIDPDVDLSAGSLEPVEAGNWVNFTIMADSLKRGKTNFIALVAIDDEGNTSNMSTIAEAAVSRGGPSDGAIAGAFLGPMFGVLLIGGVIFFLKEKFT